MGPEYSDAKRKLLEKYLRGEFGLRPEAQQIARRQPGERIPLSHAQEQVWVHAQLAPELPLYNEPVTIHYSGRLDVSALERSFNEILRRHQAWRTSFVVVDGQPFQEVKDHLSVSLPVIDLRSIPDEQREATAVAIATADARIPIDMGQTPLFRVKLIRLRDEEHRLYLTLSHIIFDGVAIYRVFLPELAALYKAYSVGEPSPLPDLAVQYPDYACWERRTFTRQALAKDIEYWREKLSGNLPEIYLPTDRPHTREQTFRGSMYPFRVKAALTTALRNFCRSEGASLFHVLLAGFAALLYRQSGEERIPIGSVTAGRNRPETSALLGYFLNTVVMPADLSGDPSFRSLVQRARNWTIDALDHDRLPFEHLVRELKVDRVPGRNPLFQALFSLEPPMPEIDPAWRLTQMDVDTGASKYDLSLELDERSEEVLARFHYNTDLFDAATIVRMAAQWQRLLQGIVADPDQRISELPLLTTDEQRQIVVDWNNTEVDVPGEQIIHKYFEEQAQKSPGVQAVAFDGQSLTYDELNCQANQVARYLRELGVGPEVVVALFFERSIEMVVGILGVLKAGGACLPLDPTHPAGRLAFMLAETQAPVLLTHSRWQSQAPAGKAQIICIDTFPSRSEKVRSSPPCQVNPDNTAYVIYTSGSTGQPKGVRVLHRGMVNSTFARIRFYPEAVKSFLLLSSFTFDSSLAGIFWTLTVGGTLVLPPDQSRWELDSLSRLVEKHQVSHLLCVPSLYKTLMESSPSERLASLKVAIVAGESCPVTLVKDHFSRLPHAALYNEYGPTEATVWCSVYRCEPRDESNRVPIGRPIANTQLYVLDSHLQVVPVGVPGELHVAGAGVTGGYWNRPDLTAERFIPNSFSPIPGARLYKTGDLARFLPDGNIEYLGRIDHQVKVRGFRIELGEIEAALRSHPSVGEAVVIAREDTPGDKRLVTYYTAVETSTPDAAALDAEHLRALLLARLPEYMVPAAFVRLTSMPLTPNGKLDRKALPAPEADAYAVHSYQAPRGEIESALAAIWGDVFKLDRVGRHDNFFELGGHSLLAVILIERMRRKGLQVDVRALFATSSLAELAATVEAKANIIEIPPNRIPAECTVLTSEMLPLVKLTQDEIDRVVGSVPGGVANVQDIYPLAPLQEGILFHHLMSGEGDPYLLATLLSFDTRERLDGYLKAMQSVINRNDILRTAVMWEGLSQPVQVVEHKAALHIQEIELDPAAGDVSEQLYARFDPRRCRIDLRQAPLLWAYIAFDKGQNRWLMMQLLHHLLADHTTMEVMQEEIQAHLLGQAEQLPAPLPFRNLVAQARLGVSKEEHEAFFRKMLADVEEPTTPFGLFDVQGDGTGIEEARVALEAALAERVRERARRLGISAASLCHLAWARVVAKVSGRDDVVFGTVLFGRMQGGAGSDRVMGLFTNTLPVRIRIGEEGVEICVRQTHALLAGLMRHEHASLALAQRCSAVPAPAPLFSALLNYRHSAGAGRSARAGEDIRTIRVEERTNYPFTLSVDDVDGEGFWLTAQTLASVNPRRICEYMQTALESLVAALETAPSMAVRSLEVLPGAERHQLLYEWNETQAEFPSQQCIHRLFEEQVRTCPDATAVVYKGASLSYAELNRRANRLAHYLRGLGVKPDARVAICVDRGLEMVVALLAVLKAGGAYVPLDPAYPIERLRFMLEDCIPVALLTQAHLRGLFTGIPDAVPLVDLSADTAAWRNQPDSNPDSAMVGLTPQHPAYVIYTSGSTGVPKGVEGLHRASINRFAWMWQTYPFNRGEVCCQKTNLGFVDSVWEIFGPLLAGIRNVIIPQEAVRNPEELFQVLAREHVSRIVLVPSLLRTLLDHAPDLRQRVPELKLWSCSGEVLPAALAQRFREAFPEATLLNIYGSSEVAADVTCHEITDRDLMSAVAIGKPISNTQIYLVDECLNPVPVGVRGQIFVGGDGLARGYLNRPELTAERFVMNWLAPERSARLYRTGDVGRFRANGEIEYLGRVDNEIKLRGQRMELGEIESVLSSHAAVRQAVVIAREDVPGEKRLVAYYTAADADGQPSGAAGLRSFLSSKLPDYMVPAAYVRLTSMPLTPSGKLDRKALPAPEDDAHAVHGYEAPQDEIETALAAIWGDVLKLDRVGRHDNFFELGGHSLLAVTLIERMRRKGLQVDVRALFATSTLAELAATVEAKANIIEIPPNRIPAGSTVLTPEMLPLVDLTHDEIDRVVGSVPGGAANVQDIYPLAPFQEGILFHHLMSGEGDPYLLATLLSFDKRERLDGYLKAMQAVINRHDILRTAVMWEGLSQPVQVVEHKAALHIQEIELDPAAGDVSEQLYARFDPRRCRIDLRQAPLLRVYIAYDEGQSRWLMMQLLHHLLADNTSGAVMQDEIRAHLLGQAEQLPAPLPFRNLVAQARLGVSKEEHEAFFRKMLADVEEPTTPFGLFDVQGDGTGIEEARVALEAALAERVRERARRLGISAASLCHLAWARVLAKVSGREDVVFGTVLFGRMQAGAGSDRVMGLFTNTLPVRIRIGEEGVESCVRQIHALLAEMMRHEHASLALAQRCSAVPAPAPLFSALLNYRHSPGDGQAHSKERMRAWEGIRSIRVEERTNYPFTLSVDDVEHEGFRLTAQTLASVNPRRICEYMQTALESLIAALETAPSMAVRSLEVLPGAERHQLLYEWNETQAEFPSQQCIHRLFEEQVRTSPDATAVVYEEVCLTYAELNRRANRLAHYLRGLGVKPDAPVAICLERGLEMVVALLAVLKAGGAYVPLDPTYPGERLRFMLEDCAPLALLTQKHLQPLFAELPDAVPLVDVSADATAWSHQPDSNPDCANVDLTPQHLAYVIYTSGSTGTPKGVMVEHRNVTRLFAATDAWFHFSRSDIWTLFHSYAFDFSVWEIWGALLYGGRLIVVSKSVVHSPGEFYKLLCQTGVTILNQTPSAFRQLVTSQEASKELHQLRLVIFGGEALEVATLKPWYEQNKGQCTDLVNMYGITETTVHVTYRPLPRTQTEGGEGNLIGCRIPDLRIYILDECGEPAPLGVAGEMYIGGAGVARGYLNRPELTAERFLADPFAADAGARMYKTGDLGRWQSNGTIEFVGRNDFQVKIRGFRIELGEIEARLAEHAGVQEAVVIAREDTPGDQRLVAYYTAADTNGQRNGAPEFRSHLSSKLPGYMLPAAYVRMDRMPLTANGKLDRKALPMPEGDVYAVRGYEAPHGEIETRLVQIWADLLKVGRVGRQDNFFELGGHSLLAMQLTARIRRMFEVELPVRSVFEAPTIAGLAVEVQKAGAMGLKARTPFQQGPRHAATADASQETLLVQLEKLSDQEARNLLKNLAGWKTEL